MMSKNINWKKQYKILAARRFGIPNFKSLLIDGKIGNKTIKGLASNITQPTYIIYICPKLSYKEKVMTLAHEYGHVLEFKNGTFHAIFGMVNESKAHETAIKILKQYYNISAKEYYKFVNKSM